MSKAKLLETKHLLSLATLGHDLLDKKNYLLARELAVIKTERWQTHTELLETSQALQESYQQLLQTLGIRQVALHARAIPIIEDVTQLKRSIMGVEIITFKRHLTTPSLTPTNLTTPQAFAILQEQLQRLVNLMLRFAMLSDGETKLHISLKKTQVRVNALQNVLIPQQTSHIAHLSDSLQEQEREAQGRLRRV